MNGLRWSGRPVRRNAVLAGLWLVGGTAAARADFHIFSPYEIDLGELELEHNGSASFDRNLEKNGEQSYTTEFGTGLTPWWHSEIEVGFDREAGMGQPTLTDALVSENTFQLTEPGEHYVDLGFYVEYGQSLARGKHAGPNQITFGPLIAKDIGRTTTIINILPSRELGPDQESHGFDVGYAVQTRWNVWTPFSPAVEVYGDIGDVAHVSRFSRQELRAGPVGIGTIKLHDLGLGHGGKLKYELGWLVGATPATPSGTLRWRLEMELPL